MDCRLALHLFVCAPCGRAFLTDESPESALVVGRIQPRRVIQRVQKQMQNIDKALQKSLKYLYIMFLYIFNNLFVNNLLTIDRDSDILCLEGVSTRKS